MAERESDSIDNSMFIIGLLLGFLGGAVTALFKVPQSGGAFRQNVEHSLRSTVESVTPSDPIAESIAEGKAAARRRQQELGLKS